MHAENTHRPAPDQSRRFHVEDDIYRMTVLQYARDCTEDDIDQQFLRIAVELGITVPGNPPTPLDLVARDVSALRLTSDPDHATPTSRFSQSIQSASDSCSEQRSPTHASSTADDAVTSPPSSIASTSSRRSSYSGWRNSFRKISALRRRRTIDVPLPALALSVRALKTPRSRQPERLTRAPSPTEAAPCPSTRTATEEVRPDEMPSPPSPPSPDPDPDPDPIAWDDESRRRSRTDPQLRLLRIYQLEERDRFGRFESSQHRLMRLGQIRAKQALLEGYRDRRETMEGRHADALAALEHGHLSAEVELRRALTLERQGCETRLRHMQAYCNPGCAIEGMPARTVTKKDRRQLEQQHHVCNGIANLHASRINVLREKQVKQLERVTAKQEAELERLAADLRQETADLDAACEAEAVRLRQDFAARQDRLVARWTLAEAIERRRLENQTGEPYAPLPVIPWGDEPSTGHDDDDPGVI